MYEANVDPPDPFYIDGTDLFDSFPSSSGSPRFTLHPLVECQNEPHHPVVPKRHTLPQELIEYIIEIFYLQHPSFRALRALSEASYQFRVIVLQRYMASLSVYSVKQLASLLKMHLSLLSRSRTACECIGFHWVRGLTAPSGILKSTPWKPKLLSSLRSLYVSFEAEARSTQKICLREIFGVPLTNSPMTQLTSLSLTRLWHIDVPVMNMLARCFPGLTSLHLSCSENLDMSCCWACFEESTLTIVHSPIPNHFSTVATLTSAFAEALRPLTKLIDLHLGIFLSDENILENHIGHYDSPRTHSRVLRTDAGQYGDVIHTGTVLSQAESPKSVGLDRVSYTEDEEDSLQTTASITSTEIPPFPHGPELCPICSNSVSASSVRMRELEASLALAQKLKALKAISWGSFFASGSSLPEYKRGIGDLGRVSKTYVLRHCGRVRVRRRPWD